MARGVQHEEFASCNVGESGTGMRSASRLPCKRVFHPLAGPERKCVEMRWTAKGEQCARKGPGKDHPRTVLESDPSKGPGSVREKSKASDCERDGDRRSLRASHSLVGVGFSSSPAATPGRAHISTQHCDFGFGGSGFGRNRSEF